MDTTRRGQLYERWCRSTDGPLLVLAVAFVVVLLLPLYKPGLPSEARAGLQLANAVLWLAFALRIGVLCQAQYADLRQRRAGADQEVRHCDGGREVEAARPVLRLRELQKQAVAFYFKPVGGSYGYIGSTTTNSYGNFAKSFTATRDGTWRAQFAGTSNFNRVLGSDYVDVY